MKVTLGKGFMREGNLKKKIGDGKNGKNDPMSGFRNTSLAGDLWGNHVSG